MFTRSFIRLSPLFFATSFTFGCTETRVLSPYSDPIKVTHEEGAEIDKAEQDAHAARPDMHRECLVWKTVLSRSSGEPGLNAYASGRAESACSKAVEAALANAQTAIQTSNKDPGNASVQVAAAKAIDVFLSAQTPESQKEQTSQELFTAARPTLERVLASDASCDDKKVVPWIFWKAGRRDEADATFVGKTKECIGAKEAVLVLRDKLVQKRCDEGVAVVAQVWPRAQAKEDQIALLDAVMSCSDAFSMRKNFSFAPPEVLADYDALLAQRKMNEVRQDLAEQGRAAAGRCQENCMTMYADNGVCMNSCSGDSTCVKNCLLLRESCNRNCGSSE